MVIILIIIDKQKNGWTFNIPTINLQIKLYKNSNNYRSNKSLHLIKINEYILWTIKWGSSIFKLYLVHFSYQKSKKKTIFGKGNSSGNYFLKIY